jgi:hypothetical protein
MSFQGYALLCVGFPTGDVEVETQDEDEASTFSNHIVNFVNRINLRNNH